jgi:hypothetical protein
MVSWANRKNVSCIHLRPFVDFGNTQRCSFEQIKTIDESLLKIPPLSVYCKLAEINEARDWEDAHKAKLERWTTNKLLPVIYTNRDSDFIFPVRLVVTKEGKRVLNEKFGAPLLADERLADQNVNILPRELHSINAVIIGLEPISYYHKIMSVPDAVVNIGVS